MKRSDGIVQVETLYVTFEKHANMSSRCWSEQKPRTSVPERQAKCSIMYLLLPLLGGRCKITRGAYISFFPISRLPIYLPVP